MNKFVLITATLDTERLTQSDFDCYDYDDAINVSTKEGSVQEFLKDPSFRAELRKHGWEDVAELEKSKDAIKLSRVFMSNKPSASYDGVNYISASQIDLSLPKTNDMLRLAQGDYFFVREIDISSLEQEFPKLVELVDDKYSEMFKKQGGFEWKLKNLLENIDLLIQ